MKCDAFWCYAQWEEECHAGGYDKDCPMRLRLAKLERVAGAARELFGSECATVCKDKVDNCDFGRDLRDALAALDA